MFDDLSETPGEVLAKGQVVCMSPSLRGLPVHTQSHGESCGAPVHADVKRDVFFFFNVASLCGRLQQSRESFSSA